MISWADTALASSVAGLFKWRQFEPEVILLAVGWYLRFSLSYCDVEELLAERGISADHVTLWRWVQRYAPAPPETAQGNKRFLAGRRDVRPGERQMGALAPGRGFRGCDDRLLALGLAGSVQNYIGVSILLRLI